MCTPLTFQHFASFFWCKPTTHGSWYPSGRPANQNYIRPAPVILSDRSVNAIYTPPLLQLKSLPEGHSPPPHAVSGRRTCALAKILRPRLLLPPAFQTAEWFSPLRISNPDLFSELPTWSMDRHPQTPSTSQAESPLNSLPDLRQNILLSVWTSFFHSLNIPLSNSYHSNPPPSPRSPRRASVGRRAGSPSCRCPHCSTDGRPCNGTSAWRRLLRPLSFLLLRSFQISSDVGSLRIVKGSETVLPPSTGGPCFPSSRGCTFSHTASHSHCGSL